MTDAPTPKSSLLNEIISASQERSPEGLWEKPSPSETPGTSSVPPISEIPPTASTPDGPKKPKEPLSPFTVLKAIGSLFLVALIFFGSFLAYIVFNPEQAQFFVTTFGIDPQDVADVLKRLITISFWVVLLVLSIVWIIVLFRAIWTPKDLKRKKILSWIFATFIGVILFWFISFWAYLFNILNATDFVNPEWRISVYDADLSNNPLTADYSRISTTTNLIGPISLKFEISANARQVEKSNLVTIDRYRINFDGAICNDGSSIVEGIDPSQSEGIVCNFESVRVYNIRWIYFWKDRLQKDVEIPMNLSPVDIRWLIAIKNQKNRNNEDILTLDASNIRNLWNPRWVYEASGKEVNESSITERLTGTPQIIGLKLFWNNIDRIFLIENIDEKTFTGSIVYEQDPANPLWYRFSLEWLNVDDTDIVSISWNLNDGSIICRGLSLSCQYSFWNYDSYIVRARIELANQELHVIEKNIKIESPLVVVRKAKVLDTEWKILNTETTYDAKLRSYIIKDIIPPTKITADARDVTSENLGYRLSRVLWTFSDGKKIEEKEWEVVSFDITHPLRYTLSIKYVFTPNTSRGEEDERISQDTIIFDIENKSLIPRVSLQVPRDYVPVVITIDGSQSFAENSEIKQFTFDFGDGRPPVVWDAVQQYEYKTPGEKVITVTVTNDRWETATIKKTVVLKWNPKTVDFTPSLAPWVVWVPVDFTPSVSESNIEEYVWTFGDNTPTVRDPIPSHIFQNAGKYIVTLTVIYNDGTRQQAQKEFEVIRSEDFQ